MGNLLFDRFQIYTYTKKGGREGNKVANEEEEKEEISDVNL